jgi:hypothetical protein
MEIGRHAHLRWSCKNVDMYYTCILEHITTFMCPIPSCFSRDTTLRKLLRLESGSFENVTFVTLGSRWGNSPKTKKITFIPVSVHIYVEFATR